MKIFDELKRKSIEKELSYTQISPKYKPKIIKKEGKKIKELLLKDYLENIEQIKKRNKRPLSMKYYDELITRDKRIKEITNFRGKIIGTLCNFVPEELIYAAGAMPLRLCGGIYHTIKVAEEILPKDTCPLIKSTIGFKLHKLPLFELCDVIVVPTTCDGKKKLGDILSSYLPVWLLEVPHSKEYLKREHWFKEIRVLKRKLELFTQKEITKEKLKSAISLLAERHKAFTQFYEIRKSNPFVILGSDALLVMWTSFYDDVKRWTENTKKLCKELEKANLPSNNEEIKLLLTGAPIIWPNFKIVHLIEEAGARVVADDLCSATQRLYNPVIIDEWTMDGMIQGIAQKYLLPSTCPCFTSNDDRIDRLLERIKEFSIQGVIYHNLRMCQLFGIEEGIVREVLKTRDIPMLTLYTDYSKEDIGQLKTRIETFIEILR